MDKTTNWSEVTEPMNMEIITQTCQKFLSQLPEDQRNILLAPFTNKTPTSIPSHVQHESRSKTKTVQPKARNSSQSGSRKRRQTLHADQDDAVISDATVTHPNDSDGCQPIDKTSRSYKTLPVFLQNSFLPEVREDPKKLYNILKELKPDANIKSISVCKSGDLKLVAQTPHDENILRQDWPQDKYGKLKARLPKENTANHEVIITNIPVCVTSLEIKERAKELLLDPKDVYRFNKKGTQEPSKNVKVTLGSKAEKDHLLSHGFGIYSQHFKVVENRANPSVSQCFKCQRFGHNFYECKATASTCLRCGEQHRLSECKADKGKPKCSNCSGNHAASYKGCPIYKEEQKKAKEAEEKARKTNQGKTYATVLSSSQNMTNQADTISLLACLAECLSELVSHVKECLKSGKELNDLAPFSIISHAAKRHLNLDIHQNDLFTRGLCPSPRKDQEKSSMAIAAESNQESLPSS